MNNKIIKFRIFDRNKKSFINSKDVDLSGNKHASELGELLIDFNGKLRLAIYPCGNGDNSADSVFYEIINQDNYIIQQFTGLLDKNRKEIYEGDVCKGLHYFGPAGYAERILPVNWHDKEGYQWNYWDIESLEIVGNIFKNTECIRRN